MMKTESPTSNDLASELGHALGIWNAIIAAIDERFGHIELEWKASKSNFGWMCLLKQKKRTLLYLTPEKESVRVAIVLGERAVELALAGSIPASIKALIREARKYAEGRGIRFAVESSVEIATAVDLVTLKTMPK